MKKADDREQKIEKQKMNKPIKSCKDLKVYQLSYDLAMEIFEISKSFPKEELYSLTDQIRRSSRSVPSNIREGFAKRKYVNVFTRHLNDSLGSAEETKFWLDISKDCKYISIPKYENLSSRYDEVSAMLYSLMNNWT